MQWGGVALMSIVPFILYPFLLGFWLANDILIRPVAEPELEWYRESGDYDFRPHRGR